MNPKVVKSPFTGGKAVEIFTLEKMEFRGEEFLVHSRYYKCEDTGQTFTDSEQDDSTLNDLYSQYRIKHGIPFPDEIKAIRTRYNMNYSQISKLLGFGVNQWAKYESGQVPSESNGRLISALRRKSVALQVLKDIRILYDDDEYTKTYNMIVASRDEDTSPSANSIIYEGTTRSIDNGFAEFNHRKVEEMVKYLAGDSIFPTKMNKMMFYADFLHFKRHGISISGLRYQAIHYGPVPMHYNTIYDHIPGIHRNTEFFGNHECSVLSRDVEPDTSVFNENEMATLREINERISPLSTSEIIELSHKESAWLSHYSDLGIIPYSDAYRITL
ncbi:MAG: DUF4065 domain-containing protein [Bacteroidales bacterium]|nr:DUF4065 domain-containing protein [Bacteroidales bacterium]